MRENCDANSGMRCGESNDGSCATRPAGEYACRYSIIAQIDGVGSVANEICGSDCPPGGGVPSRVMLPQSRGPIVAAGRSVSNATCQEIAMPDNETSKHAPNRERTPEERHAMPDGQSRVAKESNPPRSNVHPEQTAEVPYGTGQHPEPPGGGGRHAQKRKP
jgi:hypothetical protein